LDRLESSAVEIHKVYAGKQDNEQGNASENINVFDIADVAQPGHSYRCRSQMNISEALNERSHLPPLFRNSSNGFPMRLKPFAACTLTMAGNFVSSWRILVLSVCTFSFSLT
jgi:hypothetical protein